MTARGLAIVAVWIAVLALSGLAWAGLWFAADDMAAWVRAHPWATGWIVVGLYVAAATVQLARGKDGWR